MSVKQHPRFRVPHGPDAAKTRLKNGPERSEWKDQAEVKRIYPLGGSKVIFDRDQVVIRADRRSPGELARDLRIGLGTVTRTLGGVPQYKKMGKRILISNDS